MTRQEYKRRWIACKRAHERGLNARLALALYDEMKRRGYSADFALDGVLYAARNGAFGFINAWER